MIPEWLSVAQVSQDGFVQVTLDGCGTRIKFSHLEKVLLLPQGKGVRAQQNLNLVLPESTHLLGRKRSPEK